MLILNKLKALKKSLSRHQPLIEIFVYKQHLLQNLQAYKTKFPKLVFAPVLKSNAYGHGLKEVLIALRGQVLPFVAVDSFFEAEIARSFAPEFPILVIDYSRLKSIEAKGSKKVSFAITSFQQLQELSAKLKQKREFHLKIDTGLHRQGVQEAQYKEAVRLIKANPNILLVGVFSHLAEPENQNQTETLKQVAAWNSAVVFFKREFSTIKFWHLAASAGAKLASSVEANAVRLGIGLYGYDPGFLGLNLKPALRMTSLVTGIKFLQTGDKVGYGLSFEAKKNLNAATVPVGYFEGVDRRLSGKGVIKIKSVDCTIIGRVSMNITSVDATNVSDLKLEDEAEIISINPQDLNSVANIAKFCQTIPYEILVHIPQHLRRTLV